MEEIFLGNFSMDRHPRAIVLLTIKDRKSICTEKFQKSHYLGDPINILRIYNEKCADEVSIIDLGCMRNSFQIDFGYLSELASECQMPLSYGGGIKSLADAEKILSIGFEKIIVNRAFIKDTSFITILANAFGSQSIVASIDVKASMFSKKLMTITKKFISIYQ